MGKMTDSQISNVTVGRSRTRNFQITSIGREGICREASSRKEMLQTASHPKPPIAREGVEWKEVERETSRLSRLAGGLLVPEQAGQRLFFLAAAR